MTPAPATTPTSGAADLLELIEAYAEARHRQGRSSYNTQTAAALQAVKDALAAGQATAAPAQPAAQHGAADGFFLLLPQRPKPEAPAGTVGLDWDAYSGAQMLAFGRDCSDAAIAALRTEQPAPSGATEEVENLRKALVYAAFALHDTPQYMLAQGITLIDGDTVRVSRDGWTVEASVNPHRQPAPATQQGAAYAALPEYGINTASHAHFRVLGFTANQLRAFADATHTLRASHGQAPAQHTGPCVVCGSDEPFTGTCGSRDPRALCKQPTTTAQADSVLEDAALWHWLAEYLVGTRTDLDDEIVASETVNDLRKLVDAAIKQGEKQ